MFPKVSMSRLTVFLIVPSKDFPHHSLGLTTCGRESLLLCTDFDSRLHTPSGTLCDPLEEMQCNFFTSGLYQIGLCWNTWARTALTHPTLGSGIIVWITTLQLIHCGQICCNLDSREWSLSNNNWSNQRKVESRQEDNYKTLLHFIKFPLGQII